MDPISMLLFLMFFATSSHPISTVRFPSRREQNYPETRSEGKRQGRSSERGVCRVLLGLSDTFPAQMEFHPERSRCTYADGGLSENFRDPYLQRALGGMDGRARNSVRDRRIIRPAFGRSLWQEMWYYPVLVLGREGGVGISLYALIIIDCEGRFSLVCCRGERYSSTITCPLVVRSIAVEQNVSLAVVDSFLCFSNIKTIS